MGSLKSFNSQGVPFSHSWTFIAPKTDRIAFIFLSEVNEMPRFKIYFLQESCNYDFRENKPMILGGICCYSLCVILCLSFTHIELIVTYWQVEIKGPAD